MIFSILWETLKARRIEYAEAELLRLQGQVVTGMGNFSYWIEKLEDHYYRKTGMHFYPGTLNVKLEQPFSLPPCGRLEGEEYGGSVSVNLLPCLILGRRGFILRTDANEQGRGHHPKTIVEVASDVKLRDHFRLVDGDQVVIEISDRDLPGSRTGL